MTRISCGCMDRHEEVLRLFRGVEKRLQDLQARVEQACRALDDLSELGVSGELEVSGDLDVQETEQSP